MNRRLGRIALLACIAAWLPGVSSAAVLSDNLANPADFERPFSDTSWVAQEFATTATAFTVNSITVPLSKAVGATGTAQLSIFSSVGGLPGSSLGLFASTDIATQVTTASTNYTFSGSTVTLAPSTSYYLVLNALPGISGAVRWGGTFDTTGIGFPSAYSQNNFSGSSGLWTGRALTQPNRMRIEAVPEPGLIPLAACGVAGLLLVARRRRVA